MSQAEDPTLQLPADGLSYAGETPPEALVARPVYFTPEQQLPRSMGVMPLRGLVLFPEMVTPLIVTQARAIKVIKRAMSLGKLVFFTTQRMDDLVQPEREDLHDIGTVGRVLRGLRLADGSLRILVQGLCRARLSAATTDQPFFQGTLDVIEQVNQESPQAEILRRHLRDDFRAWCTTTGKGLPELDMLVEALHQPSRMADYIVSNLPIRVEDQQNALAELDVEQRLQKVRGLLSREREIAELNLQIIGNVQSALDKNQREYWLREQLRVVREELGEVDPSVGETQRLRCRILESMMPPEIKDEAIRELERMERMHRDAAEHTVARTYIDWLLDMPWSVKSDDCLDLDRVQAVLDQDHSGLEEIKERVLEYLSVRQLNADSRGPILCFIGPPGVGKTSLGRSIARAMGREFQRIALGGVKDESEIRGHRRTYVGSMPGRIIQALRRAGSANPVMVLDEIDKVGNDFRGDPASALLEALDPEQNSSFTDHYLDVPFDLSSVMFICTANIASTIPAALRDRMEVIDVSGYIEEEKLSIAREHLLPRIRTEHGLKQRQMRFADDILCQLIRDYTREAGVRGLDREISKIARKIARKVVSGKKGAGTVTKARLVDFLGPPRYLRDHAERTDLPGIAVGLAWTAVGGDILFIEATRMEDGNRNFKVTGQVGEVMKESAETALSWVRANAKQLDIETLSPNTWDLHLHVPQGSIPKDGPSAGITMTAALVSLLTGRKLRDEIAMTGEITLRGKILPVGGIKEKVLAAGRAGIKKVFLPRQNQSDLLDIPEPLRDAIEITLVDQVWDVLDQVLVAKAP
ncbi:MAG: endopeptidase La [Rickettsiales bacterium]|nr:endopeptidase La [Rickettsiales bacterium]